MARRALLSAAALASTLSGVAACQPAPAAPGHGAPATASAEITGAIAAYWAGVAEANDVGDDRINEMCDEIEEAAARIAAAPCRSVADLAAKVVFFVEVMNHQNVWHSMTEAEGDVLVSVETAALALAQGGAA